MKRSAETLTKEERSILLYAEICVVDHSGLLESIRMNSADMDALKQLKEDGVIDFGRIPSELLKKANGRTHWIIFTESAWDMAHQLRRIRGKKIGTLRQSIDEILADRLAA